MVQAAVGFQKAVKLRPRGGFHLKLQGAQAFLQLQYGPLYFHQLVKDRAAAGDILLLREISERLSL